MDFISNLVQGVKDFFNDLGSFFSGSGGSTASFSAPEPASSAGFYDNSPAGQGHDFSQSQPQMRPSMETQAPAPIEDHSPQTSQLSSVYNPASNHYGQYQSPAPAAPGPGSGVEEAIKREQKNVGRTVDRTAQDVLNFPKALSDGIAKEAERQATSRVNSAGTHFRAGIQRRLMGFSVR